MNHITYTAQSDSAFLHAVGEPPHDCNCPQCSGEPPDDAEFVGPSTDFLVQCDGCPSRRWLTSEDLEAAQERSPFAPCGCLWGMVAILPESEVDEDEDPGPNHWGDYAGEIFPELLEDYYSY